MNIEAFVHDRFDNEERKCVRLDADLSDSISYITINYYSKKDIFFDEDSLSNLYRTELQRMGIINPIVITRGRRTDRILTDISQNGAKDDEYDSRLTEFVLREQEVNRKIRELQMKADSIQLQSNLSSIVAEAKVFLPNLKDVDLVESKFDTIPILLVQWEDDLYQSRVETKMLMDFVKIKTKMDTLVVR